MTAVTHALMVGFTEEIQFWIQAQRLDVVNHLCHVTARHTQGVPSQVGTAILTPSACVVSPILAMWLWLTLRVQHPRHGACASRCVHMRPAMATPVSTTMMMAAYA